MVVMRRTAVSSTLRRGLVGAWPARRAPHGVRGHGFGVPEFAWRASDTGRCPRGEPLPPRRAGCPPQRQGRILLRRVARGAFGFGQGRCQRHAVPEIPESST